MGFMAATGASLMKSKGQIEKDEAVAKDEIRVFGGIQQEAVSVNVKRRTSKGINGQETADLVIFTFECNVHILGIYYCVAHEQHGCLEGFYGQAIIAFGQGGHSKVVEGGDLTKIG